MKTEIYLTMTWLRCTWIKVSSVQSVLQAKTASSIKLEVLEKNTHADREFVDLQKWPPLIFVTEKKYLLTEINYFTVKIRSKGITV